ncbi:MAG TPA: glycosyltransferase, partial [Myxococcota bacterium]
MRIAMFEDTYWPKIDGINTSVELFSKELRKRGHEVLIVAPRHPDADYNEISVDDDTILVPAVATEWLYPGTSLGKFWQGMGKGPVAERFKNWRPDILHSHTEFTIGLWMASYWRSRFQSQGTRRVHTYHTLWTEYLFYLPLPQAFSQPLVRWLAPRTTQKRFDGVIAPTEKMRDALISDWGITPAWSDIDVVPTGIDVARMTTGSNERFRTRYAIKDDESVILYLGRIGTEKNVELVMKTFAELVKRGEKNVRFVVAGGGPESYVDKLKKQAIDMGVHNIVWTGFVRGQDWLDAYAAADVMLFPSVTETQGLVVVEALAAGVPLVSVEAMGPASTMKGERGCLFADNDPAVFATATQRLLRDEVLYERKKREALEIAKVSSVEHRTDELLAVYERVLGANASAGSSANAEP